MLACTKPDNPRHFGLRRLESYRSLRSLKKRDFANSVNSEHVSLARLRWAQVLNTGHFLHAAIKSAAPCSCIFLYVVVFSVYEVIGSDRSQDVQCGL